VAPLEAELSGLYASLEESNRLIAQYEEELKQCDEAVRAVYHDGLELWLPLSCDCCWSILALGSQRACHGIGCNACCDDLRPARPY
jgi:hypothetical protein